MTSELLFCRVYLRRQILLAGGAMSSLLNPASAYAQRTEDNAVTFAEDAFGTTVAHESIGLYDDGNVRGFSPAVAGNLRIEGLYFDAQANLSFRVIDAENIRVGPSAQGYAFPAPTGIANFTLRNSGDTSSVSPVASINSYGGTSLELDAQLPIVAGRVSTAVGIGAFHSRYYNGGGADRWNVGVVPRWRPSQSAELLALYTRGQIYDDTATPTYVPTGDFLPAHVRRAVYPGPSFTRSDHSQQTFGTLGRVAFGDWTVRAGLFRSRGDYGTTYANTIYVAPDMATDRQVAAFPKRADSSWSGELRTTRLFTEGPRRHLITLSFRGRDILNRYGGGDTVDLGRAGLGQIIDPPRASFALGRLTDDRTHQTTSGASYGLDWRRFGELTVGLQRTRYIKAVDKPGQSRSRAASQVWLPSGSATFHLAEPLSLYGSYVRGLEDAGAAPPYAANPGQLLPAIQTKQYDAGLRWKLPARTTLIAGWYSIAKPYINLDNANVYRVLGRETHRGLEASLTTSPTRRLTVVAGAMIARPRVVAEPTVAEPVGRLPVGQYRTSTRLNLNYTPPFADRITLDAYVNHDGSAAGTVDNAVTLPAVTTLGIGARYNFKIGDEALTLRVAANNLSNSFTWIAVSGGTYVYNPPRNVLAYLAASF